jgi:hypothetical protein
MIETIQGLPEGTVGFDFHGRITGEDYDTVLIPELERMLTEHERVRTLLRFGEDFTGYKLAAAWDDTLVGLRHWQGFERIAVLSDVPWLRTAVRALGAMFPCPIRLFASGEEQEARRWLSESLGTIHLSDAGDHVRVRLIGKLEPSAYEGVEDEIANLFSRVTPLHLLLDLRAFDGWSGLAALGSHLSILREHRRAPVRVAVVGEKGWQKLLERVIGRFTHAETRFFDSAHSEQAEAWLQAA